MRSNTPLPVALEARGFRVADAHALGISAGRLRSRDLARPLHGVRAAVVDAAGLHARLAAARAVIPDAAYFTHQTAALLYGAPLPRAAEQGALHVSISAPHRASRRKGLVWHEAAQSVPLRLLDSIRVAAPANVWCQLAGTLSLHDLVAVGDFFVTGDHPIRAANAPLATLTELNAAVRAHGSRKHARLLREALALTRYGPLSRPETLTRFALIEAGLPEPALNFTVHHAHRRRKYILDLAYPELRLGLDYEGDYHRTDAQQFRTDIRRREELAELGWEDTRVPADDLAHHRGELASRVALHRDRALARMAREASRT